MNVISTTRAFYMKNTVACLFAFFLFVNACLCSPASGQMEFGFKLPDRAKKITIPFEQHNNLIVIPVTINNFITLKFILDTGVEAPILTEKLYADILGLNYVREIVIAGPGIVDSVEARIANQLTLTLPGGVRGTNMNMLVLKEDYLKLSESIGESVHGIIGYDIFSRFVVDIDYDDSLLTLYRPSKFKKQRKAIDIPIEIRSSKPFIKASIQQENNTSTLGMMVDTGASHAALLDFAIVDSIQPPDETVKTRLGRGIAGEIPGFVGRIDSVAIDCFTFHDMLVSAPMEGAYNKVIKRGARAGTFGGELLNRFNVTFDYQHESIYLRKGRRYRQKFDFDMSGLTLMAKGNDLDSLEVVAVDMGSPADHAGLSRGDIVLSINGKSLSNTSLTRIYSLLRARDGKKIKCRILRGDEKMRKQFHLRRVI